MTIRYVIPRWFGINTSAAGPIQVLARFPLEPKRTLYVVKVAKDIVLVGSSESGLQFLKELDPADFEAAIQQAPPAPANQFSRVMENLRNRKISS